MKRGAGPKRPAQQGCNCVRIVTWGLFIVCGVWLLMGISMFRQAAIANEQATMAEKLRVAEADMARRLKEAENALSAAVKNPAHSVVWNSPEVVHDHHEGDDSTVKDHAAMGHDFGAAAAAAGAATPPPEKESKDISINKNNNNVDQTSSSKLGLASKVAHDAGGVGWDQSDYESIWVQGREKLPQFWAPPEGTDLDSVGTLVDGEPTIYLMVASYRDFQCPETITSALERARFPSRVIVGAIEQNAEGDVSCIEPRVPCEEDPTQVLCSRRDQIRLFKSDSKSATGPVFARHVGDRLYRGETYTMQLDAHVQFIKDWDMLMISQFHETKNEYAVLSTYLTDVQKSISKEGLSLRKTRPIMCNSHFEGGGETSHLRHLAQPEEVAAMQDTPMLQPFWAAGMSFSRGHFVVRVPYDCCLPMLFQGEEISIGIRAWTFGYDLYAPHTSVIFHEYAVNSARRRGVHSFWENRGASNPTAALRRMVAIVKMAPDIDPSTYDHKDEELYGLGTARPVEEFYRLFGMDVRKKTVVPEMCKWVKSGKMHKTFVPALRENGKGIDYSGFKDYDVYAEVRSILDTLKLNAETRLKSAISKNKLFALQSALEEAKRARNVDKKLVAEANALVAKLK
jgi:hypothetical protein